MDSNSVEITFLYPQQLLKNIDYSNAVASPSRIEFNLVLRPLRLDDFNRGFLQLLQQLTKVGNVDEKVFRERFHEMQRVGNYYVTVIEDVTSSKIVATATLFTEYKFIHDAAIRGRIEDVVVDSEYRGQRLGHLLIETLKLVSQKLDCYKVTLDCSDDMVMFYTRLGFKAETGRSNMLTMRFRE
jgi:glucosamine-phosphate N-acetyltransferase